MAYFIGCAKSPRFWRIPTGRVSTCELAVRKKHFGLGGRIHDDTSKTGSVLAWLAHRGTDHDTIVTSLRRWRSVLSHMRTERERLAAIGVAATCGAGPRRGFTAHSSPVSAAARLAAGRHAVGGRAVTRAAGTRCAGGVARGSDGRSSVADGAAEIRVPASPRWARNWNIASRWKIHRRPDRTMSSCG